eukprot:2309855-Rhodomonas_salina.1
MSASGMPARSGTGPRRKVEQATLGGEELQDACTDEEDAKERRTEAKREEESRGDRLGVGCGPAGGHVRVDSGGA